MALAQSYNPSSPKKSNSGGISEADRLAEQFSEIAIGPETKIFRYAIIPEISRGIPIIGQVTTFLKWAKDPVEELRKELNLDPRANILSPKAGEYYASKIISGTVGWGLRVVRAADNLVKVGSGGSVDPSLVRSAVAFEYASDAASYTRNPTKYIIGKVWNGIVKGGFIDNFIYDKEYLFYSALDKKEARYLDWANKGIVGDFNQGLSKFGRRIEGPELKLGAHVFAVVPQEKSGFWSTPLKLFKVGWQVAVPTVITAVLFPPAAPLMLAFQAASIDWGQFVGKSAIQYLSSDQIRRESWRWSDTGEYSGRRNASGQWFRGGERLSWQDLTPGSADRKFYLASKFLTLRGLYDTIVTGKTFREIGWQQTKGKGFFLNDVITDNFKRHRFFWDPQNPNQASHYFSKRPGRDGLKHVGYNRRTNSFVFEQRRLLADGREITLRTYRNERGKWVYAQKTFGQVLAKGRLAKIVRGGYYIQQFARHAVFPVALAVALPNPITGAYVAYSLIRYGSALTSPLKRFGWAVKEGTPSGLSPALVSQLTNNGKAILVWFDSNGNSWQRRLARGLYSIFNPLDREVGWLRGLALWRDQMWLNSQTRWQTVSNSRAANTFRGAAYKLDKLISRIPAIGFVYIAVKSGIKRFINFLKATPVFGFLVRAGGLIYGLAKWVNSPVEALTESIQNFFKWLLAKGIKWALKKAWQKWLAQPARRLLLSWAQRVGSRSFLGRILRYLRYLAGKSLRPSPSSLSRLRGFFNRLTNLLKDLPRLIQRLFNSIRALIRGLRALGQALRAVGQAIKSVVSLLANPGFWVVFFIVVIILAVIWIAMLFYGLFSLFVGRYGAVPVSDYLSVEKIVTNPKPAGQNFLAGEEIRYEIRFQLKKPLDLNNKVTWEDFFLISAPDNQGGEKYFFDESSIECASGQAVVERFPQVGGPSGTWVRAIGGYNLSVGDSTAVDCSVKVDNRYSSGELVNQAIVSGLIPQPNPGLLRASASVYLYLNSGRPSGWPVDHACITQGPNGVFSHQGQQAIDFGSNTNTGYNIDAKPVYSTVDGQVLRICLAGQYNKNFNNGACGGYDEGSYFGDGFGTYVIIKGRSSPLVSTFYAHLAQPRPSLQEGEMVKKGEVIGEVDNTGNSTGPHLHYALTRNSSMDLIPPLIPYYVPTCSDRIDCLRAFTDLGEADKACF